MNLIKKGSGDIGILMLHGRGSDAEDIISLHEYFNATCYAFTANNNQWYPLPFNMSKSSNEPFLADNINLVIETYKKLKKEHNKIFLLGFSQGACLALEIASKNEIDGVIAFSGGLIGSDSEISVLKKSKVFIGCSHNDPFIPFTRAKKTVELFEGTNSNVITSFYEGNTHTITSEELSSAIHFFNDISTS